MGDLFAEAPGNLWGGDVGVLDGVVQQAGGDGGGIHLHFGKDLADFKRVDDIGFAAGALLAFVLLHTKLPRIANDGKVVCRTVAVEGGEQVVELFVDGVDLVTGCAGQVVRRVHGSDVDGGCRLKMAAGAVERLHLTQQLRTANGVLRLHGRRRGHGGFQIASGVGSWDQRGVGCSGRVDRPLWKHI